MAITKVERVIVLDIYDHNATPTTIKAIACDNDTRYVAAEIQNETVPYDIGSDSQVQLTIIRPDKVGVAITGQPYPFTYETGGDPDPETGELTPIVVETRYGVYAEMDQPALALSGTLLGQFKITSGTQILRTEIFYINAGRALDEETSEWADEYQGYNLDELVAKVDGVEADVSDLKNEINSEALIYYRHNTSITDSKMLPQNKIHNINTSWYTDLTERFGGSRFGILLNLGLENQKHYQILLFDNGTMYQRYITANNATVGDWRPVQDRRGFGFVGQSFATTSFVAWDFDTKTLSVKGTSFVVTATGDMPATFKAQTVDFSNIETTYDAYRIYMDDSGNLHGRAWNDTTPTDMYCIGLIYGRRMHIFGFDNRALSSKKVVYCFGDSITAGTGNDKPYHQWLGEMYSSIFYNWGIGGTGYAKTATGSKSYGGGVIGDGTSAEQSGNNTVLDVMTGKDFSNCIIFAGTNDYGGSIALSTFRTAVQNTLDYALTKTSNILVITPLKRENGERANSAGAKLSDYSAIIKEECEARLIGYVDGYDINIDPNNATHKTRLMPDGLHPNDAGQERLAGGIYPACLAQLGV